MSGGAKYSEVNNPAGCLQWPAGELCVSKRVLAEHYGTGVRTIEEWLHDGLITATRKGRLNVFNVAACDVRLLRYTEQHRRPISGFSARAGQCTSESNTIQCMKTNDTKYSKRKDTADYFGVSVSTIKNWMKMGLLVFIKVRRVVRFDIAASEGLLRQYGYLK